MNRKLTITISEAVYLGLYRMVGRRGISGFLEELARPHVAAQEMEASYREMAADQGREQDAMAWSEGVVGDSAPAAPHVSR